LEVLVVLALFELQEAMANTVNIISKVDLNFILSPVLIPLIDLK